MTLARHRAKNHPQQTRKGGANDEVDDRATTADDFESFARLYGPFTIDVAAAPHNTKCERFYDRDADGLSRSWAGETVWCNPPYSAIRPWVEKAWQESPNADVVMLLPANRTEQTWWQDLVEPHRDRPGSPLRVHFLPGRMRFIGAGRATIGANERPPFGCVLVVWHRIRPVTPTLFDTEARS